MKHYPIYYCTFTCYFTKRQFVRKGNTRIEVKSKHPSINRRINITCPFDDKARAVNTRLTKSWLFKFADLDKNSFNLKVVDIKKITQVGNTNY